MPHNYSKPKKRYCKHYSAHEYFTLPRTASLDVSRLHVLGTFFTEPLPTPDCNFSTPYIIHHPVVRLRIVEVRVTSAMIPSVHYLNDRSIIKYDPAVFMIWKKNQNRSQKSRILDLIVLKVSRVLTDEKTANEQSNRPKPLKRNTRWARPIGSAKSRCSLTGN